MTAIRRSDGTVEVLTGAAETAFLNEQVVSAQEQYDLAVLRRKARYESEADPLFMEYMYESEKGNPIASTKRSAWVAKVDQIKADIPLPTV